MSEAFPPLPAESEGPLGRGRFGFVSNPDSKFVARAARALRDMAAVVNAEEGDRETSVKPVNLGHVVNQGVLALALYSFPILDFDDRHELIDLATEGTAMRVAVVANQPVALQIQAVISFLSDFVARNEVIEAARREGQPHVQELVERIDTRARQADQASQVSVVDDLQVGWEAAARNVARRAIEAGFRFDVSYQAQLISSADARERCWIGQEIYNRFENVRKAIDRTVAVLGEREPQVYSGRGREQLRILIQQHAGTSYLPRYISHSMRDAFVGGNGYLAFRSNEPFNVYCLPPDATEIRGDRYFVVTEEGFRLVEDNVHHMQGLVQPNSEVGVSLLEVLANDLALDSLYRTLETAGQRAEAADLGLAGRRHLGALQALHERLRSDRETRIQRLFPVPLGGELSDPRRDLYFSGHSTYGR